MAAYHLVCDLRQLQADCQEPRSAPEPCTRQSTMGYFYLLARRSHEPPRTSARPIAAVGRVDDRLDNRFV